MQSAKKINISKSKTENKILKSNNDQITVYCRFRPISSTEKKCKYFKFSENHRSILIDAPEEIINKTNGVKKYIFSRVFDESIGQKEVFNASIHPVLLKMLNEGKNALVFTYGVTNAGKTYTIIGDEKNPGILINTINWFVEFKKAVLRNENLIPKSSKISIYENSKKKIENVNLIEDSNIKKNKEVGSNEKKVKMEEENKVKSSGKKIEAKEKNVNSGQKSENDQNVLENNPIDLDDLFIKNPLFLPEEMLNKCKLIDIKLNIQCFEIYNDELHDLFSKKSMKQKKKKLIIREVNKRLVIENLKNKEIKNFQHGNKLIKICLKNRSVLQTALNKSSSRSHCVYKIKITFILESDEENIKIDKSLTLVDLAGSERAKRTENTGKKLKEANKINQSLSCLGRCLSALKTKKLAPFRETKLTRFFNKIFIRIFCGR